LKYDGATNTAFNLYPQTFNSDIFSEMSVM